VTNFAAELQEVFSQHFAADADSIEARAFAKDAPDDSSLMRECLHAESLRSYRATKASQAIAMTLHEHPDASATIVDAWTDAMPEPEQGALMTDVAEYQTAQQDRATFHGIKPGAKLLYLRPHWFAYAGQVFADVAQSHARVLEKATPQMHIAFGITHQTHTVLGGHKVNAGEVAVALDGVSKKMVAGTAAIDEYVANHSPVALGQKRGLEYTQRDVIEALAEGHTLIGLEDLRLSGINVKAVAKMRSAFAQSCRAVLGYRASGQLTAINPNAEEYFNDFVATLKKTNAREYALFYKAVASKIQAEDTQIIPLVISVATAENGIGKPLTAAMLGKEITALASVAER